MPHTVMMGQIALQHLRSEKQVDRSFGLVESGTELVYQQVVVAGRTRRIELFESATGQIQSCPKS